jgi:hypothetical protein
MEHGNGVDVKNQTSIRHTWLGVTTQLGFFHSSNGFRELHVAEDCVAEKCYVGTDSL